jgi:D-alanine transaminase
MTSEVSPLPDSLCFLNGDFGPLKDAKISVLDRGFIFGDGVYEVAPVYGGALFCFERHMARLERSLAELRIANPFSLAEWREIALKLVAAYADKQRASGRSAQDAGDQVVYIQISRGVAPRDHVMPIGLQPTVFMMTNALKMPSAQQRADGVACVSADDFRWEKAHIKSTSLLGAVFSRQISFDAGALETVMFRGDFLSEAASSNVWVVRGNTVLGPLRDKLVLAGIRYSLIEEMCRSVGLDFELRRITRAEVLAADEILLSSATKEVLPVTLLDGQPVGHGPGLGKPGPVYAKLYAAYQAAKSASQAAQARTS